MRRVSLPTSPTVVPSDGDGRVGNVIDDFDAATDGDDVALLGHSAGMPGLAAISAWAANWPGTAVDGQKCLGRKVSSSQRNSSDSRDQRRRRAGLDDGNSVQHQAIANPDTARSLPESHEQGRRCPQHGQDFYRGGHSVPAQRRVFKVQRRTRQVLVQQCDLMTGQQRGFVGIQQR